MKQALKSCGVREVTALSSTADTSVEEIRITGYSVVTAVLNNSANGENRVVFDTAIEEVPAAMSADRPWGPGNNPMTAVREFLQNYRSFRDRPRHFWQALDHGCSARLPKTH